MASIIAAAAIAAPALGGGGIDPLSGIDFVRIGAVGNAPWMGTNPPTQGDDAIGRGSVDYEYFIGRYEVTTSQWVQFFNAAYDRPAGGGGNLPWLTPPTFWGAQGTTPINNSNPNARRWQVPAGNEMRPVGNISWRMAAMYCNFLHNGGAGAAGPGGVVPRENFLSGAYDVSTFGPNGMGGFADQATRSPGARYFIPTRDEWIKAAHYDPHRYGENQGGYWEFSNSTDAWVPGGPPGVHVNLGPGGPGPNPNGPLAQANYGWDQFTFPGYGSPFTVPLGAYPDVQSPWGLLDVAGATTEWTEQIAFGTFEGPSARFLEGSYWGGAPGFGIADAVWDSYGQLSPGWTPFDSGFRVASIVPGPTGLVVLASGCVLVITRRRQR
ncbi:MAG: SUMF1/EgtB/PvdO family nonheme iron enzyme [Phycisphaeraceae bacterium]|nr:SUMF1/EgtB/PvdO family nonheme iron enzyme [Phycisphaeraceae bacterium]